MDAWLEANETTLVMVLAVASAVLLVLALVFLALWLRSRRTVRSAVRARAAAERERIELELTLAEQGSRLRMTRELHDIAVHSVSGIITQADGARYAATQDPSAAARSAAVIADAARDTLADLRRAATVARAGEEEPAPQLGLAGVEELFGAMRDSGLEVEFRENGDRHELRDGAELAIFRILQEALANALDHGGPGTHATVTMTWTDDGLQLLVDDDGTRARAIRAGLDPYEEAQRAGYTVGDDLAALTRTPSGRGITEMRERAELFGGVFEAHDVAGVGFTVQAVFPAIRHHNGVHGVPLTPR